MMNHSYSTGEARLLNLTVEEAKRMLTSNSANAFRSSQVIPQAAPIISDPTSRQIAAANAALIAQRGTDAVTGVKANLPQGNYSVTGVTPNYDIRTDPTYAGSLNRDSGYTGTPKEFGNVGPSAINGQGGGWEGGVSGGVSFAGYTPLSTLQSQQDQKRQQELSGLSKTKQVISGYDKNGNAIYSTVTDPDYEKNIAAIKNRFAQEDLTQVTGQKIAQTNLVGQNAGAAATGAMTVNQPAPTNLLGNPSASGENSATAFSNKQLTSRLNAITGDRQAYIEKRRAEGVTDQQIRTELASGAGMPTNNSVQMQTSVPVPTDANSKQPAGTSTTIPDATKTAGGASSTDTSTSEGKGDPIKSGDPNAPPAVVPSTVGDLLRAEASKQADPMNQINYLIAAKAADELGNISDPISEEAFYKKTRNEIGKGYDLIDKIYADNQARNERNEAKNESNLKYSYEQQDKILAAQQENANNQLTFANQKATRDQADANKKFLDSQTIMLALQGGFGSADGNREIAEARLKGEEAIINLNKEYGFKKVDVGLQYTAMHNEAYDKYQTNLLETTDAFETRISNLAVQRGSNAMALEKEIQSSYKDYVTGVKENRKTLTTALSDAIKPINDAIKEAAKAKKDGSMSTKDKLGFVSSLRTGINQNKTITQANDADGFYGALNAAYGVYESQLADPTNKESLNAAQTAVVGSFARILDPNSVVRNEEYERQVYGQSWINTARGLFEKAERGGTGMTKADVDAMKKVADQIHSSWESRLQTNMQPFILDIQDWNANYPDAQIDFAQVIPVDRIHLPKEVKQSMMPPMWGQVGGTTPEPPSAGFSSWSSSVGSGQIIKGSKYHTGSSAEAVDIDGKTGDPIKPMESGRVISIDDVGNGGLGKHVVIEDDYGYTHTYAHLDTVGVRVGQATNRSTTLGGMGNTGNTMGLNGQHPSEGDHETGSHLHYMITKNGKAVSVNSYMASVQRPIEAGDGEIGFVEEENIFIPTAHAAEDIHFNETPVLNSGTAIQVQSSSPTNPLSPKTVGKFRNIQTGQILTPTNMKDVEYYKSKPYGFEDMNAPKAKPVKQLTLGGKPLPQ